MTKRLHSMKYITARCGLSAHVIRVWEKRYAAVKPVRSDGNQRLYSDTDLRRLEMLAELTRTGHTIGRIARLTDVELETLYATECPKPVRDGRQSPIIINGASEAVAQCKQCVANWDVRQLEQIIDHAVMQFGLTTLANDIIPPLLHDVGDSWEMGALRIGQEHATMNSLRNCLGRIIARQPTWQNGPFAVVGTLSGQHHEFGSLLAGITAAGIGWNVLYMGPNLPAAEIVAAVEHCDATLAALSFVHPSDCSATRREIRALQRANIHCSWVAGGNAVGSYADDLRALNCNIVTDFRDFRKTLEQR